MAHPRMMRKHKMRGCVIILFPFATVHVGMQSGRILHSMVQRVVAFAIGHKVIAALQLVQLMRKEIVLCLYSKTLHKRKLRRAKDGELCRSLKPVSPVIFHTLNPYSAVLRLSVMAHSPADCNRQNAARRKFFRVQGTRPRVAIIMPKVPQIILQKTAFFACMGRWVMYGVYTGLRGKWLPRPGKLRG